jgi:hypothetical protein
VELNHRDYELSEFVAALPAGLIGRDVVDVSLSTSSAEPLKFGYLEIR